jgi:hypothetical protein
LAALRCAGLESTSLSYRTKDIKCSEVNGKRQQKVYTAEKMRLQLARTPAYCKGAVRQSFYFYSLEFQTKSGQKIS